jgi:hypothetical protein
MNCPMVHQSSHVQCHLGMWGRGKHRVSYCVKLSIHKEGKNVKVVPSLLSALALECSKSYDTGDALRPDSDIRKHVYTAHFRCRESSPICYL